MLSTWPGSTNRCCPVVTSQIRKLFQSSPPAASVLPSGLKTTELTSTGADRCVFVTNGPRRIDRSLPDVTSHSLTVWSLLAEARVLPSGENATDLIACRCPCQV